MIKKVFAIFVCGFIMLIGCSEDKGTNPVSNNSYDIVSLKILFECNHYNHEYYTPGDTVDIRMIETTETYLPESTEVIPLPDSVEVTITSKLGDMDLII